MVVLRGSVKEPLELFVFVAGQLACGAGGCEVREEIGDTPIAQHSKDCINVCRVSVLFREVLVVLETTCRRQANGGSSRYRWSRGRVGHRNDLVATTVCIKYW